MPDLWVQLDETAYKFPPQSYLTIIGNRVCRLKIQSNGDLSASDKDYGILGMNFLENYLQLYDLDTN